MNDVSGGTGPDDDLTGMTGRRGALVGGLWNAAQMVLPLLGTTMLSVVLGRLLGPELLGVQSLISYSEAMLAGVLVMSLNTAAVQLMSSALGSRDTQRIDSYARWVMIGQLANGLVSALILIVVGLRSDHQLAWILAGITGLLNAIGWGYASRIIAETGSWTAVARWRLITQMLAQLTAAVAVLLGAGLTAVFGANLVSAVLLTFALRPMARKVRSRARRIPRDMTRLWALFLVRSVLLQVVAQRIEFLFLAAYSTPDQIAMYSIPFMVVTAVVMVPGSIITAGMPAMAARQGAGQGAEVADHLGFAVRVTVAASVPLTFALAILGPPLITVLYGSEYVEAGVLLAWLSPLVLVLPAASVAETYWNGLADLRLPIGTAVVAAVLDLVFCFILIPRFDALGAAWANLIGQGIGAIALLLATRRLRPSVHLPWLNLLRTTVAMAVLAAVTMWVLSVLSGIAGLLMGCLVAGLGAALYGRTAGFMGRSDALWLRDVLPHRVQFLMPFVSGGKVH